MKDFYRTADIIEIDSIPMIYWARLIGRPSRRFHRSTYLDWRNQFWRKASNSGWRVFFVGGREEVCEQAKMTLRRAWPDLQIEARHGFFDPDAGSEESRAVLRQIRAYKPDVLFVGMGMPLQETWIVQNLAALPRCAIFTVGGAFDYEAGVQVACPRWIGQLGGEWLFRLALNPKRLFARYCIEPWFLLGPAAQDVRRFILELFGLDQDGQSTIIPLTGSQGSAFPSSEDRL